MASERIGIIFVHGIGEQRRFEHLKDHVRPLVAALAERKNRTGTQTTVEIVGAPTSALHAEQDTWAANPEAAVRIAVRENGVQKDLFCHEVWWADVNEPYSLWKQVKFWGWGLSLWATPGKYGTSLAGGGAMQMPVFDGWHWRNEVGMRLRLFFVSNVFAVAAFSLGAIVFLAKRLVGFNAPSPVRVFVNYISAVKLYSQRRRSDGGFLDAYNEPPRVSIRRRMIRTLVDVASADYDRWYILAHSLGSVVAFNGLMENAHALPNYLDESRWKKLRGRRGARRMAGPAREGDFIRDAGGDMTPGRPLWLADKDVVFRDKLFKNFRGLLTYGCPLDKFAALWPAKVPINTHEKAFEKATWINVYDPTDPVAARLDAFGSRAKPICNLYPVNYGYRAHPVLLYSHLRYLHDSDGKSQLSDAVVEWILSNKEFAPRRDSPGSPWFEPGSLSEFGRGMLAIGTWLGVYLTLLWLGVLNLLTVPFWKKSFDAGERLVASLGEDIGKLKEVGLVVRFVEPVIAWVRDVIIWIWDTGLAQFLFSTLPDWVASAVKAVAALVPGLSSFVASLVDTNMFKLAFVVALVTEFVGLVAWLRWQRDDDDVRAAPTPKAKTKAK